jgi:hypothetical protein
MSSASCTCAASSEAFIPTHHAGIGVETCGSNPPSEPVDIIGAAANGPTGAEIVG